MLIHIARFEFRYLLKNPLLWGTAAATFALLVAGMSVEGFELGSEGGLLMNAAYATLRNYLVVSVFFMFVTTAFVAGAVLRDDHTGFGPIVRSTRITKFEYVIGRFLGAFAVAALCLLVVPVGIWLGSQMPWANPAALGPNRLADHLYAYVLLALPNVFVHSAVFFALATITRSLMGTYLGVIGFVSGFFVLANAFEDRPQLQTAVALADPFGGRALADATRYWTVAERNVLLPDFTGALLYNRLLWIGVGVLCLAFAYAAYRYADQGMSRRERRKQTLAQRVFTEASGGAEVTQLPSPRYGTSALRVLLWMRTRFEMTQVVLSPAFPVLMAWGLFTTLVSLTTQRDPDGKPSYPTTLSMIPELENGMALIPLVIAIYYAGELVWRERDRRMHEIVGAAPMPNWGYVVPKTLAMALVLVSMLLTTVVASVAVQLSLGYTDLEPGKYLLWYVLPLTWDMLLLAALAVFVQALSPHKAVGWGVMVLFVLWQHLNTGIDHVLLNYGATPAMPLSDLNGAGSFWKGAWTLRLYWGAFSTLLLVCAHLLWGRGTEVRLKPRLALARRRLAGSPGWVVGGALLTLLATGAWTYYNTNVLNRYQTPSASIAEAAEFERRYWRYHDLPQPSVAAMTLDVALYPEERRAVTTGRYRLRNLTAQPIPDVHVRYLAGDLDLTRATVAGARLVLDDPEHGYRIYRLDRPMRPGEERVLAFETRRWNRGFRNGAPSTVLVENGTFLNESQIAPFIGMSPFGLIQDPAIRRRYGLPEAPRQPVLEDLAATAKPAFGRTWATSDVTVSTSADQTPLAPGDKVSDVTRGGRRTARFVSGAPIRARFSVLSARYAETHRRHAGVDLAVYYHPAHAWNVDRMLDAMAASLDYYQANFGSYQFNHARIVEFPGYHDFAQAFAGTIPYSETVGFISNYTAPETIDYVTGMTAHELAHQYWAHQLVGAEMEGDGVLTETLAQYSALMVVKRLRGRDQIRRFLQFELDEYLDSRSDGDPPLVRESGQHHVIYDKGSLVMYLLQERLGEAAVNRALRKLLQRYRFRGAPYPRSLDLVAALRAEARTPEAQALITDLFERVTLYDLKVTQPSAVRRADGRWDVSVPVEAAKVYVDGHGVETEAPLAERIEVGLFTAEPGRDAFDTADVIRLERQPVRSGAQTLTFVTDRRPTYVGVDPYNYYIDRDSGDNVAPLN
ncbi:MAG TPA: M1 family aminopeptidase [Rubricoccaceae bacterium]|jgi:ABC-type transport system involved in multi-copper enzyme maturation permease subunit